MRLVLTILIASTALSGCGYMAYFVRDRRSTLDAIEVRMDPAARRECLVVLMPGLGDTADAFLEHGFVDDAAHASSRCDFVAVDAHLGYYTAGTLQQRVGQDILRLADARGYREIWLVGISLGGLGSLLVARDHPELVDGVVLLAPYLDERVTRSVIDAGGLARWEPRPIHDAGAPSEYANALFAWLKGYVDHPSDMPALYLGVGTEDRLEPTANILGQTLPPSRFFRTRGGHDWSTWRVLWRRMLHRPPWAAPSR